MKTKLSGWQKAGLIAGVGCFSILAVLVLGVVIAVVWARSTMAELGDTTPTQVERAIALPPAPAVPADGTAAPGADGGREPHRLTVDLQEGEFTIRPGAPGSQVRVAGTFAEGLYELTDERDEAGGHTTIRFRSTAPMWVRIFSGMGGGESGSRPEVTVTIPQDMPIDLSLQVSMGESHIDLGGLTLRDVNLDLSMGEHEVDFAEPVVDNVRRFRLNASMGNVSIGRLGNARAAVLDTQGSMGNVTADLGGAWPQGTDAELSFTQSMGELTVRVPSDVRLETDIRRDDGGGDRQEPRAEPSPPSATDDPDAPRLRLRVTTSMGESRVVRY